MVEHPVAADYKWKKYTRATCKAALEEVNKSEDNCPIVLEKMTFNVFSHNMSTKKSKNSVWYISATSYCGVWSYLTHMYRMSGKMMDGEFKK